MDEEMGLVEDIVESKTGIGTKVCVVLLWICMAVFIFLGLSTASLFSLLFLAIGVGLGIAAWWFTRMLSLEYEYSYFEGEIHVAKVFKKESRKEVETIGLEEIEIGGPIRSYHLDNHRNKDKDLKTSDYSSHMEKDPEARYVLYGKDRRIVFEPSEKMVRAMHDKYPRKLFVD